MVDPNAVGDDQDDLEASIDSLNNIGVRDE